MTDMDLRFYYAIFLRRLPYFVPGVVAVMAVAIAIAYLMPPVYTASAKILLDAPQIATNLASSTVPLSPVEQLQIVQQQITTRDTLLALADNLKIYGDGDERPSPDDIIEDMRSRLVFEQVPLEGKTDGATVFTVSFDAADPDLAATFVNELVADLLTRNVRRRTDRAESATKFFDNEVARLGSELKALERQILNFKTEHKDALPEGLDFRRNKQSALQERLLILEREEAELRSRRSNIVELYGSTGQVAGAVPLTPEQQQLQDLNHALSEQLAIFSEASPAIVALRARIAAVRESLRSQETDKTSLKGGPSQLDLQLSAVDERLGSVTMETGSITRELADLAKAIDATPANEAVLNSLERDRANVQAQYNADIARLAEASTGEQIELLSKGPRFSVLEAATPPERPTGPNRRRIVALGGVAGIGLGIGLVVLLEMLNKTLRRPMDIVQIFQAQPLATIPYLRTELEPRQTGIRPTLAGLFAAGAAAAARLSARHHPVPSEPMLPKTRAGLSGGRERGQPAMPTAVGTRMPVTGDVDGAS
jgi:polysaccharide biosynthesis transport protein